MLKVLDLFSGIGGFSLGLERTGGFQTVAFCEIKPFPRAVLAKHWPEVPCYDDVRTFTGERLAADGIAVDIVCGGFPCQDISAAGRGAGIDGERSSLWREYARIVGEVGPRWVVVENSPYLRTRGADRVLGDMEAHGYTCRPFVVGAAHAGAPHRRARVFILAHSDAAERRSVHSLRGRMEGQHPVFSGAQDASGTGAGCQEPAVLANRDGVWEPQQSWGEPEQRGWDGDCSGAVILPDTNWSGLEVLFDGFEGECSPAIGTRPWAVEPSVGRMAHGVPNRAHRIAALGNAVCPPIIEAIGHAILAVEAATNPGKAAAVCPAPQRDHPVVQSIGRVASMTRTMEQTSWNAQRHGGRGCTP